MQFATFLSSSCPTPGSGSGATAAAAATPSPSPRHFSPRPRAFHGSFSHTPLLRLLSSFPPSSFLIPSTLLHNLLTMTRFLPPFLFSLTLLLLPHLSIHGSFAAPGSQELQNLSEGLPSLGKSDAAVLQHKQFENVTDWEIFPDVGLEQQFLNSSRRMLGTFEVCALCTCCGEQRRFCIPSACCYTITCGSPNRPFGFCSFLPISCNCFSCGL